jgi:hypothetical protein
MRLAFLKLYSFEYKAKTGFKVFSLPNKFKISKLYTEINKFENH